MAIRGAQSPSELGKKFIVLLALEETLGKYGRMGYFECAVDL